MKVASYLEDTRHMLVKLRELNMRRSPLPQQARLVSVDAVGMYPNTPADGDRGGVKTAERALQRSGMEPDKVGWVIRLLKMVLK